MIRCSALFAHGPASRRLEIADGPKRLYLCAECDERITGELSSAGRDYADFPFHQGLGQVEKVVGQSKSRTQSLGGRDGRGNRGREGDSRSVRPAAEIGR